jgi:hypothetical protein
MHGSVASVTVVNGGPDGSIAKRAHYAPPWADVSIIGIAGSSGSGKSTLSQAIVSKLNLPWVVILSIVCPAYTAYGFLLLTSRRTPSTRLWVPSPTRRLSGTNTTLMHLM